MGSDVSWQLENGFAAEVQGDFSSSTYDQDVKPSKYRARRFSYRFHYFKYARELARFMPGAKLEIINSLVYGDMFVVTLTDAQIKDYVNNGNQPFIDLERELSLADGGEYCRLNTFK
ncbi:hypothetical protein CTA21_16475 [Salmonella enterica]|nr:hypothetical protein [Salmonella enterica]